MSLTLGFSRIQNLSRFFKVASFYENISKKNLQITAEQTNTGSSIFARHEKRRQHRRSDDAVGKPYATIFAALPASLLQLMDHGGIL